MLSRSRRPNCCEYINSKGELTHVLSCCCDCEVIDSACDRCLRCESQPSNIGDQMSNVLADRLRIPWIAGSGAVQIQLDVFSPILIIPTLLVLSITHYYVAWSVCVLTPLTLISYYKCWRNNTNRTRTRFFYSWGLVSIFTMGYIFIGACCYREIELWEGMIVLGLFLLMMYSLYLTKQDAGSVRHDTTDPFMRTLVVPTWKLSAAAPKKNSSTNHRNPASMSVLVKERLDKMQRSPRTHRKSNSFSAVSTSHSSERPVALPALTKPPLPSTTPSSMPKETVKSGCDKCNVKLPPRASHCNVCNECYSVRDHHCIWLDQCIGLRNHRAFLVTILLFLAVTAYGLHLTLTTICTPIMVLDFFLIPYDCKFVYADLVGAISYVSCCYTIVAMVLVSVLLIQQLVLISQNITLQEFNAHQRQLAYSDEDSPWWRSFIVPNNPYNRGFKNNWLTFLRRTRHEPPPVNPMDVVE